MKILTFHMLSYRELNHIVNYTWYDAWKLKFDCASQFGWTNDTDHCVLDVQALPIHKPEDTRDKFERQQVSDYETWSSGRAPHGSGLYRLLDSLCTVGAIPPGNYIVRVSW